MDNHVDFLTKKGQIMKKLISFGMGLVSVLAVEAANASDIKLFVGGNIALNSVSWDEKVEKHFKDGNLKLPENFFGLGAEAGARLKTNGIYNPGITLAYDYAFDSAADIKYPAKAIISSLDVGFSAISGTFDNYIRFSGKSARRSDIVLGIGLANVTERADIRYTPAGHFIGYTDRKGDDNGTFVVLKVGFNFEITDHVDFYANGRWFAPTKSNGDLDALFNLNAGIRYVF